MSVSGAHHTELARELVDCVCHRVARAEAPTHHDVGGAVRPDYAALRADPEAWKAELDERAEWDWTLVEDSWRL